ncbi:MAG: hypothetical protein HY329_17535, partial [Chloroflexi bacterium]|nr:hypothetical protein [Chloroflexota bacterium]
GWGDPFEREPERVLADVRAQKVTVAHAREAYGVAIDERTLDVDRAETERLRSVARRPAE